MKQKDHILHYEKNIETIHSAGFDSIYFQENESISLNDFFVYIDNYCRNAVSYLPINGILKQKILGEVGIEPYDINKIKSIYKIGRQYISIKNRKDTQVYGECQPRYKNGKFSFTIAMENNAPKKLFLYFLYHEIDHMIGYLAYQFSMQSLGFNEGQIIDGLLNEVWDMKTEFFARVNTANKAMLGAENWDFVFNVGTGIAPGKQDIYSQSMNYATKYIGARNMLYNLLLKKYGIDKQAQYQYASIKEPGYSKFVNICKSFAKYLFFIDSLEGFYDFIDRIDNIVKSSSSIEIAIERLCGNTGEMKVIGKNINLIEGLWNEYRNILLTCK